MKIYITKDRLVYRENYKGEIIILDDLKNIEEEL